MERFEEIVYPLLGLFRGFRSVSSDPSRLTPPSDPTPARFELLAR
jgi:hypothetical protein